jgi:LEA14-like dessication related protein
MAKANTLTKILLPTALAAAILYGVKKFSDQKNAFKLLRIGVASADSFQWRAETASIEFALTLLLQNLGSLSVEVKDFVGKAFVNGKEFGFANSTKPIVIKPKSESKQTIYLSIPVQNLIQTAGLSLFQIIRKGKNKKVLSHAIKFEGVATLAGGLEVPVDQTINI